MPLYRIERTFTGLFAGPMDEARTRALACADRFPGVKWKRSYLDPIAKTMSCIYEAPDGDAIRRHSELAKIPCDLVTEVIEIVATK